MQLTQRVFSSRGGTFGLAGVAAALAAVTVFAYISNYRHNVQKGGALASVLVAKSVIHQGTSGEAIQAQHLFYVKQIRESQLVEGAVSDLGSLRGKVAASDIIGDQQLTASDFTRAAGTLSARLVGDQRAITVPIDSAHGILTDLRAGDHVDVYAGFNVIPVDSAGRPLSNGGQARAVIRLIIPNVPVLGVGKSGGGGIGSSGGSGVTLLASGDQASRLAFAADNGKLWFALRPPSGAKATPPDIMTLETLLLGIPPKVELRTFGGRR